MNEAPNPFAPPKAEWVKEDANPFATDMLMDATQGVRFVNLILDSAIRFFLLVLVELAVGENAWISIPFLLGYYLVFEALFARTPAKWITRTRVIAVDGSKPTFPQILGRTFSRFVPFEPFSFLGSNTGWHDRWSRTRVVRDR